MANYCIGCDLGGTNLRAAIVDTKNGTVVSLRSVPTMAREGQDSVVERMCCLIRDLVAECHLSFENVEGIGIGIPGTVDLEQGIVHFLPNFPGNWPNVPLADSIAAKTGLPVFLLNDVRSITFGEWKCGAGKGAGTMACFAIGTGIGGGLVINNQLHLGRGGTAGELGHQTVDINGPLCGCGNRGCVEVFASGPAIAAMGMRAVKQGLTTRIGNMCNYDLNQITPEMVCKAAWDGDKIARGIFKTAGSYLGIAVANILVAISPDRVVIGGGVAQAGDLLFAPIRQIIRERVFMIPKDEVEIVRAKLGDRAGVIGSAMWAKEQLGRAK